MEQDSFLSLQNLRKSYDGGYTVLNTFSTQ